MVELPTQKFILYSHSAHKTQPNFDILHETNESQPGSNACDLNRIVEQMPAVLWTTDLDLNLTYTAGNVHARFDPGHRSCVGMPLSDFFRGADNHAPALDAHCSALGGYAQAFVIKIGDYVYGGMAEPLFNSDFTLVGTVGVLVDIGRPLQAEQERTRQLIQNYESEKRQGIMNLARNVGNHFSGLFKTISSSVETLRAGLEGDHPHQKTLAQIEEAARCAADLADQLRNSQDRTEQEREPLDLEQLIADHVESFAAFVSPRIKLECDLDRDHPDIIGERDEIRRLLTNLLFNAAAAIGEEEGTISVRTQIAAGPPWVLEPEERFEFPEGEYVWLQVSDTGAGLDEAARGRMFEPFAGFTGHNLGLATALRIVDRHHGVLSLSSKPGLGTTCHVFLPILPHADPADKLPPDSFFLTARRLASCERE